jgi:beta-mannosidase
MQLAMLGVGALSTVKSGRAENSAASGPPTPSHPDLLEGARWKRVSESANPAGKVTHHTLNLNGTWSALALPLEAKGQDGYVRFTQAAGERLEAQVPGEIHLDLMRAGRMPDPNVSDNARTHCRWPEQHSWWYRTEFIVPKEFRQHLRQRLIFDGIDLYGQVFVNGHLAGSTRNAFAAAEFDVMSLLKDGVNELVVRVTSGLELIPPLDSLYTSAGNAKPIVVSLYGVRSIGGHRSLRKPDYAAYGHDWCDPLPNIGIWKGVRLEGHSQVVLHHLRLDTVIRGPEVSLDGEVVLENLHPWSEIATILELHLQPPQGPALVQHLVLGMQVGRHAVPTCVAIPDAQLWWPNGMGEQPLYTLTARVICGQEETDRQVQTIGLRTIQLDRSALPNGSRFGFKVNGHTVYCKGGNWAPADLIPARIEPERYRKWVAEAKNAHFTMLCVNGVGLYESKEFYDACDRAGILVWQDFAFSDAWYPDQDPEFVSLVQQEAESVVRRLRHHASLALWCGNSECQWLFLPKLDDPADSGGARVYNEILPEICHRYDPVRPYWPGSPLGGVDPNSESSGDTHGWKGGTGEDIEPRIWQETADACRARFLSEYYCNFGPPHIDSVREYLRPDELSLASTAWKIHSNISEVEAGGATAAGIRYHYGEPEGLSLERFIFYGQMYQALLQGGAVEATRFRKGDPKAPCAGALTWSYNETWGEVGWAIIDHYLRRKASYYWFKRAAAPVKVLVRSREGQLVTRVVNDTLKSYQARVSCGWLRLDGRENEWQRYPVTIPVNGMLEIASASFPSSTDRDPREWLFAAMLTGKGIPDSQAIWTLAPHRDLSLLEPEISIAVRDGVLKVESPVYCHGVHLEDEGREVLADNYFDLLPGLPRHIDIVTPTSTGTYALKAIYPR